MCLSCFRFAKAIRGQEPWPPRATRPRAARASARSPLNPTLRSASGALQRSGLIKCPTRTRFRELGAPLGSRVLLAIRHARFQIVHVPGCAHFVLSPSSHSLLAHKVKAAGIATPGIHRFRPFAKTLDSLPSKRWLPSCKRYAVSKHRSDLKNIYKNLNSKRKAQFANEWTATGGGRFREGSMLCSVGCSSLVLDHN